MKLGELPLPLLSLRQFKNYTHKYSPSYNMLILQMCAALCFVLGGTKINIMYRKPSVVPDNYEEKNNGSAKYCHQRTVIISYEI